MSQAMLSGNLPTLKTAPKLSACRAGVRVDVDPTSRNVFTFVPQIVKANNPTQWA